MSATITPTWAAFVRSRADALTEQAAQSVDHAMVAFAWLVNAQRWAWRRGDRDLAAYCNAASKKVLLHKWAA